MGNLNSFWNAWKSRFGAPSNEAHGAVSAIYNNTIDYNSAPVFNPTTESVNINSMPTNDALLINSYISDFETPDDLLNLNISTTDPTGNRFEASIDNNHYLDFNSSCWNGDGTVSITVDDNLENSTNMLLVNVNILIDDCYICGDVNNDGAVNIIDVTFIIDYKYKGGAAPDPLESADVNNDGGINILDTVYLINFLYKGGPSPICPL